MVDAKQQEAMTATLFIGGPADGRRIQVPDNQHYCEVFTAKPLGAPRSADPMERVNDSVMYSRIMLTCGSVFTIPGMTPEEMMGKLLAGYHPGEYAVSEWSGDITGNVRVALPSQQVKELLCEGAQFEKCTIVFKKP